MIPSAHIDRSYHGLLRGKKKPCVRCGHNYKIADRRFHSRLLFKKHRIEKEIDGWPLAKIPIVGKMLTVEAKIAAVGLMVHREFEKRMNRMIGKRMAQISPISQFSIDGGRNDQGQA